MSELQVNTINENSSGNGVTIDGLSIKDGFVVGNHDMSDMWVLTTNSSYGASGVISSNWARPTGGSNMHHQIGTGMTESSGIFTFPSTGIYRIDLDGYFRVANDPTIELQLQGTTDNSSYNTIVISRFGNRANAGATYGSNSVSCIVDVTDTSNVKIRLNIDSAHSESLVQGGAEGYSTGIRFTKIGTT